MAANQDLSAIALLKKDAELLQQKAADVVALVAKQPFVIKQASAVKHDVQKVAAACCGVVVAVIALLALSFAPLMDLLINSLSLYTIYNTLDAIQNDDDVA